MFKSSSFLCSARSVFKIGAPTIFLAKLEEIERGLPLCRYSRCSNRISLSGENQYYSSDDWRSPSVGAAMKLRYNRLEPKSGHGIPLGIKDQAETAGLPTSLFGYIQGKSTQHQTLKSNQQQSEEKAGCENSRRRETEWVFAGEKTVLVRSKVKRLLVLCQA